MAKSFLLVSGSSGLIGSALVKRLGKDYRVTRLLRSSATKFKTAPSSESAKNSGTDVSLLSTCALFWDPEQGVLTLPEDQHFSHIIHLGGANIAAKRWSRTYREEIKQSRLSSTRLLTTAIAQCRVKPKVVLFASAIGFYGDAGVSEVSETSPKGQGFLADLCAEWEDASADLDAMGVRRVLLRTSTILSPMGGVLKKLLPLYKMGVGLTLGQGRQYMSWISLADAIEAINFCLKEESLAGPVNLSSPLAVTNKEFNRLLNKKAAPLLHLPNWLHIPAPMLKLSLGEMAQELLLSSTKALPEKLLKAGFIFKHPTMESALEDLLRAG